MRRYWQWFLARLDGPAALGWLAAYIFLVSFLLPLPSEAAILVIVLGSRVRPRTVFAIALGAAALGAAAGYFLAAPFAALIPALIPPGVDGMLDAFTFLAVFVSSVTPLPHQPFVIAAGLLQVPFLTFISAFILGRAIHFAIVIWILATARRVGASLAERKKPTV